MFTPLAVLGASLIGSGVGSIGGGFLSEALGFGFHAGAMIGGIVGGIVGGQIYKGISANIKITKNIPNLGNKLDYAFGRANGNAHNIKRSIDNMVQLSKIGIHDNTVGRAILKKHFINVFKANKNLILRAKGEIELYSLLAGPGGFRGVKSIWEGAKLITFIFYGG